MALPMLSTGLLSRKVLTSPVRFLGRRFLLRALWNRAASSVVLAVDKATHDDRARAGVFVDDVLTDVPAHLRPVLVQCKALEALGRLEFQEAMVLSEEARVLGAGAPAEIRGWCSLQSGDVLMEAGQHHAAQARWREAYRLLHNRPNARYWAIQVDLRVIESLTAELTDTERCLGGLRRLYRVRVGAVRDGDLPLLDKTEMYLLRLMNQAGNAVGVVEHLTRQREYDEGLVPIGDRVADYAARALLLATLYLDIVENPERYPDTTRVDEAGQRTRYHHAATLMDEALRHLSRATEPVLQAQAYAVLARVQAATGLSADALGNALESLNVVQRVRYQLPTSGWRARWVAAHAHTYALALQLAADSDPALVAELLEAVRAQAVPVEAGLEGNLLRSVFDSLVATTHVPGSVVAGVTWNGEELTEARAQSSRTVDEMRSPESMAGWFDRDDRADGMYDVDRVGEDADRDPVPTDPLRTDVTILVDQASWIGGDQATALDLDHELTTMAPGGWYWSFARVGDWIYHAVRSPHGKWSAHRQPHGPFAEAFRDLVLHLPVEVPGAEEAKTRLLGTGLVAEHPGDEVDAGTATAKQVWTRILDNLGFSLIPEVLSAGLTTAGRPVSLAVAPTASLMVIPVWALRISPLRRVADIAAVSHVPSIALLAHRRRLAMEQEPSPRKLSDRVVAILAPHRAPNDPWRQDLPYAASSVPPRAEVVTGPVRKADLAVLLARRRAHDSVLFLSGHVDPSPDGEPGGAGFRLAERELFGLRDFYTTDRDAIPLYRMPDRVVLAGCASLGVYGEAPQGRMLSLVDAPEWLGLGAAVVYGGAHHVLCTLFPVIDGPHTQRIDLALVDAMRHNIDPAWALRATQLAELRRWESGDGSLPAVFLAYVYVGLGAAVTHGANVRSFTRAFERVVTVAREPEPRAADKQAQSLDAILPAPRVFHPQFRMLARHTHDQAGKDDRLSPNVLPDGSVEFHSADGRLTGPIAVQGATWNISVLIPEALRLHSETEWRVSSMNLVLTDTRLVMVASRPLKDGRSFAGHLRYPWICSVGFRPKQSFLNDCEIVIETQQEVSEGLDHFNRLTVRFDKDVDSGELASDLVRRIARHHLSVGDLPDIVVPDFTRLLDADRLPDPDKGEYAVYYMPAFKPYPYGVGYTDDVLESTWLGPRLNAPS
ncbi:CHAT domain-containing protein [Kibdelosporangium philippinense]|uniref:CHAT domain-containing protein n=1 Tax=Kibdelosporangium philippinense TaxID=211113 RepID=A0ABS8Z630_9PSEU|nr:CHAT domain-containing protein [Kibdelosporangium philippinense]